MKYLLHKHLFVNGQFYPLQEKPDICESMTEAVETFKDAFKHLLGRKPTESQVGRISGFDIVKGKNKCLEYRFCVTKQRNNLTGAGILV